MYPFVPIGIKYCCDDSSLYYFDSQKHCSDNVYTSADWNKMEQAGAVFLPAAGHRLSCYPNNPCTGDIQCRAFYWSSTDCTTCSHREDETSAYSIYFDWFEVSNGARWKYLGLSVRLVKDL